jgi:NAD(P)-dependent dehydrogenase (short-subunit alcohol dehydrogenase family)
MTAQSRRVAVITGASSGVGKSAAKMLAADGWHVIGHGRDAGRSLAAGDEIRAAATGDARVDMLRGDLALIRDAARLTDEIAAITPRIDAMLCNAGGMRDAQYISDEGHEATFAGNHLGHFLMVQRLLPQLRAGKARIISTSSTGHLTSGPLDFANLEMLENWESGPSYCQAKLCNILFTRELARRYVGDGIIAHAFHPGVVDSNFVSHLPLGTQAYMATLDLLSPDVSGAVLAWLACAEEPSQSNGKYWHDYAQLEPGELALDDAVAARLWEESERLVAEWLG